MKDESVKVKIAKLLRMADPSSGASQGEIDNAMKMVRRLLDKHNLKMSEINTEQGSIGINERMAIELNNCYLWERDITIIIKNIIEVQSYFTLSRLRKRFTQIYFIGEETDISAAVNLYLFLRTVAMSNASKHFSTVTDRKMYCEGFVLGCIRQSISIAKDREERIKNEAKKNAPGAGNELIYIGNKLKAIKSHMDKMDIEHKTRKSKPVSDSISESTMLGYSDGLEQDLLNNKKLGAE